MKDRISSILKRELAGRHWSARQLALKSALQPDMVQAYVRGRYEPSLSSFLALCKGLGWTVNRFVKELERESD